MYDVSLYRIGYKYDINMQIILAVVSIVTSYVSNK